MIEPKKDSEAFCFTQAGRPAVSTWSEFSCFLDGGYKSTSSQSFLNTPCCFKFECPWNLRSALLWKSLSKRFTERYAVKRQKRHYCPLRSQYHTIHGDVTHKLSTPFSPCLPRFSQCCTTYTNQFLDSRTYSRITSSIRLRRCCTENCVMPFLGATLPDTGCNAHQRVPSDCTAWKELRWACR